MKSDVYSFGALLLQIISGKRFCPLSSGRRDYGPLNTWVSELLSMHVSFVINLQEFYHGISSEANIHMYM